MSKKGLLKWAGGKEREMPFLKKNFPIKINNYYEPFVGGGSVYLSINANHYYINDLHDELHQFYKFIFRQDEQFKQYLDLLDNLWLDTTKFFENNIDYFLKFIHTRHEQKSDVKNFADSITENFHQNIYQSKYKSVSDTSIEFEKIFQKIVKDKIQRILKHEVAEGLLNDNDLKENFKSALKSAVYTYIRSIYNHYRRQADIENPLYIASFYFMRNYCYSSMFRFNANNEFNVPYGGISYNENYLNKKIGYIYSKSNLDKYSQTNISNLDFEHFLTQQNFKENDFIFLDPPYDSNFSNYDGNTFTQDDQKRLANILLETKTKWLLVIKKTDFIESLYSNLQVNIDSFEKKYQVSFKNRNNKDVEHLIIKNYSL